MSLTHCCVFTRGEFFIREAASNCLPFACSTNSPFKKIGNISSGIIEVQASVIGRENEFNLADPKSRQELLGVNLNLTINCGSKENLKRALFSDIQESDQGSRIQDFCVTELDEDSFLPFEFKGVSNVEVLLRNPSEVTQYLVLDQDYIVNSSGVQIIREIELGQANTVRMIYDYDNSDFHKLEFFSKIQGYKEVYFKGINYGEDELALFDAQFYRVLFAPNTQLDLISKDEFLTITLAGTVESKDCQWFNITKQE